MPNVEAPATPLGVRLGYFYHKASTTLTAVIGRVIAKASTSGAADTGHLGVGTHLEDEAAVNADYSATPLVLIGGKLGSHVAVAAGDVGALQVAADGSLLTKQPAPVAVTLLASAARTTTQTGSAIPNVGFKGIKVIVNITSAGTGSITPSVQERDPIATSTYRDVLVGTPLTANGNYAITIYPTIADVANAKASEYLSDTFRIVITANNANSVTYSVAYVLLP